MLGLPWEYSSADVRALLAKVVAAYGPAFTEALTKALRAMPQGLGDLEAAGSALFDLDAETSAALLAILE